MKISHLAYYIIEEYSSVDGGITPLKLQKLLYYTKAWGLVSGQLSVSGQFKAWKNGPVNGHIYHKFKENGNQPIPADNEAGPISAKKKKLIDFVLESYVYFDAVTLSAMTHEETPWEDTAKNEVISEELIKEFYSSQPFAKNFPIKEGNPYYPVYTDFMYSFIFDFQEEDQAKEVVFDSFEDYKQMMSQSKKELKKHFSFEPA
ncbi:MAG TPA: type II toxin-antitoxin system antitoxin SocA domain-containing protein [Fodinibius sp.]|nr:type II toxin-antitoxin system antitoxin SocA domain-containing protein [Fodinibius sp.]